MRLPDEELTPEQSASIVDVLIVFARHGRALRLEREAQQKAKTADALGSAATVLAETTDTPLEECTDASTL